MKPVIGITCGEDYHSGRYYLSKHYTGAVVACNGVPLLLPAVKEAVAKYVQAIDGLILSGGLDVDPVYFNEEPHPNMGEMTPGRDEFEILLVKELLRVNKPLFAICRGVQVLNIAAGGNIYQDIYSQYNGPLKHQQQAARDYVSHYVSVGMATKLHGILKVERLRVNSFHHQAVRDVAPGFVANARSADGLVEGIESTRHRFVIGVQWHPECTRANDVYSQRLFSAFVAACR